MNARPAHAWTLIPTSAAILVRSYANNAPGLPSWVADRAGALLADATRETATERAVAKDRVMGQECAVAPPPSPDPTPAELLGDEPRAR
jgi:hypothetical protein